MSPPWARSWKPEGASSSSSVESRVERIVEPFSDQIERQNRQKDRHARDGREVPRGAEGATTIADHLAPAHYVGIAEAEESETCLHEDRGRDHDGTEHDHWGQAVRQDLAPDDAGFAHAEDYARLHELPLTQRQELGSYKARDRRP